MLHSVTPGNWPTQHATHDKSLTCCKICWQQAKNAVVFYIDDVLTKRHFAKDLQNDIYLVKTTSKMN